VRTVCQKQINYQYNFSVHLRNTIELNKGGGGHSIVTLLIHILKLFCNNLSVTNNWFCRRRLWPHLTESVQSVHTRDTLQTT
jgi:hypothetical protein